MTIPSFVYLLIWTFSPTIHALPQVSQSDLPVIPSATSSNTAIPTPSAPISTNGRCGPDWGSTTCTGSLSPGCCSRWGWCGTSVEHCGVGCQIAFGTCSGSSSSSSSLTSSSTLPCPTTISANNTDLSSSTSSVSATASSSFVSESSVSTGTATSSSALPSATTYYFFRTRVISGRADFNDLYLYGLARAAAFLDPVFRLSRDPQQVGAIVNSQLRWLPPSGTTSVISLHLEYQDTADWQDVTLSGSQGSNGLVLDATRGLIVASEAAWQGWVVCPWTRGGLPQLFWLSKAPGNTDLPDSCAVVELVPERRA